MSLPTTDPAPEQQRGLVFLSCLALITGLITGFGAIFFRGLIAAIHNLFFLGTFSVHYDANIFTPAGPWGPFIILAPIIGGMVVTALVTNFAPEARGHGVPEVMDAIYYKEGVIRPIVAVVKSIASAFSIGSGAAVGREGPIIQIGASLGSSIGQILRLEPWQRITLVGAGAGAGIAATFNTPIGGVMFAIELMMPEVSVRTFLPVALATGTATFVGNWFLGPQPAFAVPILPALGHAPSSMIALGLYALLGAVMGVAAAAFVRGLSAAEDAVRVDREPVSAPRHRHAVRRRVDLCAVSFLRALLRRGRRLRDDPGLADEPAGAARHPAAALRRQACGDLDQPRLRRVGRHFLAVALYGRDARRRLRPAWST